MLGFDRGDTLVEVLFAVSVFGLVSVLGISVMNQATATSQRALQITVVRQEIDAQAEVLRFLNNSYIAAYRSGVSSYPLNTPAGQWGRFTTEGSLLTVSSAPAYTDSKACPTTANIPSNSFILNPRTASIVKSKYSPDSSYAHVTYNADNSVDKAYGLWVQAVKSTGDTAGSGGYIDFYIMACWENPGQTIPLKDATVVRLYEPR